MPFSILDELVDRADFWVGHSILFIIKEFLGDFLFGFLCLKCLELDVISLGIVEVLLHLHRKVLQDIEQVQILLPIELRPRLRIFEDPEQRADLLVFSESFGAQVILEHHRMHNFVIPVQSFE